MPLALSVQIRSVEDMADQTFHYNDCGTVGYAGFVFPASCKAPATHAGLNQQERSNTHMVGPKTGAETPCCTAVNSELDQSAHVNK